MEEKVLFEEKQRFKQWWIWLIIISINGLSFAGIFIQVIGGRPFGNHPASNTLLFVIMAFVLIFTLFFFILKMETKIDSEGISVRFFPFHLSFRIYSWNKISKAYVRQYSPIWEFGGWGIRGFRSNRVFNVSGNMGLQLEFEDGRKLLIGTNRTEELGKVLEKLGKIQ